MNVLVCNWKKRAKFLMYTKQVPMWWNIDLIFAFCIITLRWDSAGDIEY